MDRPVVLIVGTGDTKSAEMRFLEEHTRAAGANALMMDVSVLGEAPFPVAVSKHAIAEAAGTTIGAIVALGDENAAMTAMAKGAAAIARRMHGEGAFHGMLALGGTMGTDLALDVAATLPLGTPKFVVSTIAFSHLIPPERLAPDLMMILWAGGLFGLNAVCRSVLAQAAGAVVGACRASAPPTCERPTVAVTSLGTSTLSYVKPLVPALEARGYEVAVFHATGMGGRAMEALAAQHRFVAVFDFALQEFANLLNGSPVNAGQDRLQGVGRAGVPQLVAPGALDMIDFPVWAGMPERYAGRSCHVHNRLIASVTMTPDERRTAVQAIAHRLAQAHGQTRFILPIQGINEFDRPGQPLHDPVGLAACVEEARRAFPSDMLIEVDAHINDVAFADAALAQFDAWVAKGVVQPGSTNRPAKPFR